jgi:hypothetical protein
MSDQGERWNAPGGEVNDYAPTDRSMGPMPRPGEANPFAAPAPEGGPAGPQPPGSGVTMASPQESAVGRLTFSAELIEVPDGRTDFSPVEFPTPGFPPPPPLEPAAAESATSGLPAPEFHASDFREHRYAETEFHPQGFPEQGFSEQGFSEQEFPAAGAPRRRTSEMSGFEAQAETPGARFGTSAEPPAWDSQSFDGVESGAGDSNYAGVDMSGPGTPPKPGMPSSGNWRMPEWMAEEGKDGGATPDGLDGDEGGGRSRVALFAGVSLLVIALVAAAVVFLLKSSDNTKNAPPSTPATGAQAKKTAAKRLAAGVALPPEKQLQKFTGTHSPVAGRINDTFSGLSYPRFGPPWQVPTRKSGLALLGWSGQQIVVTERNPKQLWYGQLMTGVLGPAEQDIYGGSGTEREAAVAYAKSTEARLYGFAHKTRPLASQPLQLNGHKGWLVSSFLTFHRTGVKATGDIVTVAVIDTGRKSPAVLLMAVPNTHKKLWPDINFLVSSLKVLP